MAHKRSMGFTNDIVRDCRAWDEVPPSASRSPRASPTCPLTPLSYTPVDPRIARDPVAHATEIPGWVATHEPVVDVPGEPSTRSGQPETRARVLVVDDNPDLRAYVANLLMPTCRVFTAADGVEPLEAIRVDPPDIVLSDVMMPRLDGFGLVREIRADPRTSSIPVSPALGAGRRGIGHPGPRRGLGRLPREAVFRRANCSLSAYAHGTVAGTARVDRRTRAHRASTTID